MSQKAFNLYAGIIFLIVAIVHALRLLNGWDVTIDEFALPVWASWAGVVVAACLAYHGLKKK